MFVIITKARVVEQMVRKGLPLRGQALALHTQRAPFSFDPCLFFFSAVLRKTTKRKQVTFSKNRSVKVSLFLCCSTCHCLRWLFCAIAGSYFWETRTFRGCCWGNFHGSWFFCSGIVRFCGWSYCWKWCWNRYNSRVRRLIMRSD